LQSLTYNSANPCKGQHRLLPDASIRADDDSFSTSNTQQHCASAKVYARMSDITVSRSMSDIPLTRRVNGADP
jgi:hypothetical protein